MRRIIVGDWLLRLARYLFAHRTTPHSLTGVSPSELLMGRRLKTHLDLLHPDLTETVRSKQHDNVKVTSKCVRSFSLQEPVFVRNYAKGPKWMAGVVESVSGPVSYVVKLLNGLLWQRHLDQIMPRKSISLDNTFAETRTNDPEVQSNEVDIDLNDNVNEELPQSINEPVINIPNNNAENVHNNDANISANILLYHEGQNVSVDQLGKLRII